ncbi:MAG TPA: type II toxin-antitoxin system HicA family toxin [Ignavibacteria bacterium]|nr:type II toxin-antitoxin system HicA family toxin [Ignavibacteria bacterium]
MTRLPRISGKDLVKALSKIGFAVIRIRGSHHFMEHEDGRATVVPVHSNETLGPGLLNKILKSCEISRDDLISIL